MKITKLKSIFFTLVSPAGLKKIVVTSFATAVNASPIPAARAEGLIFKNEKPDFPNRLNSFSANREEQMIKKKVIKKK